MPCSTTLVTTWFITAIARSVDVKRAGTRRGRTSRSGRARWVLRAYVPPARILAQQIVDRFRCSASEHQLRHERVAHERTRRVDDHVELPVAVRVLPRGAVHEVAPGTPGAHQRQRHGVGQLCELAL